VLSTSFQILATTSNTIWPLILVAFLIGKVLALVIKVHNKSQFLSRLALICTTNPTPLAPGARMNIIASRCGITISAYARNHRWLRQVAIIEGLIHVTVAISSRKPDWRLPEICLKLKTVMILAISHFTVQLSLGNPDDFRNYHRQVFNTWNLSRRKLVPESCWGWDYTSDEMQIGWEFLEENGPTVIVNK
jgi:hypothetical protein